MLKYFIKIYFSKPVAIVLLILFTLFIPSSWMNHYRNQIEKTSKAKDITFAKISEKTNIDVSAVKKNNRFMIGTWSLEYPSSVPVQGSLPITVTYRPDVRAWHSGEALPTLIAISIFSDDMKISPDPLKFSVDLNAIASDLTPQSHTWIVSAKQNAKNGAVYTLLFNFNTEPFNFRNDNLILEQGEDSKVIKLLIPTTQPVSMKVQDDIPILAQFIDTGRLVISAIGFLLALPAFTELVKFLLSRSGSRQDIQT